MKQNYFPLMKRVALSALFLGSVAAMTAFTPKPKKDKKGTKGEATSVVYFDATDYVQFTMGGLSDDVIANGSATASSVTTNDIDGTGYCYLEVGYQPSAGVSPTSYGLPADGVLTNPNDSEITFQIPDYDANNALRIETNGAAGEASVTFTETGSYEKLYFAVTSGSGAGTVSGTINFDDGSTQSFSGVGVPDWYNGNSQPILAQGIGRVNRNDDGLQNPYANPRVYQITLDVDVANWSKTVTGVTFQKTGGVFCLFAGTGKLAAGCPAPSSISSVSVGAFDAELTWTAYDANDTFEVAVVLDGAAEPTSADDTAATNSYTFTNLTPETAYDAYVRTVCTTTGYSYWEGPFSFTTAIACPAPTSVLATGVTTTDATITWDAGTGTSWEVAYVPSGDPAPTTGDVVTSASYDLSSLTENTGYDVYVRTDCGANGYSTWSMYSFVTACSPAISLNEGFESTDNGAIPNCWSVINGGDANTWAVQSNYPAYPHSGSKFARITYSGSAHDDYLITPAFTVTANVSDIISFWSRNFSSTYVDEFNVLVSTTGNQSTDFTDVLASNIGPSTTYTEYTYDLSAYAGQTIYFAIQAISTNEYYLFIDDLMTSGSPICDVPTDLAATNITPNTATLSWVDAGASSWEIVVQDQGTGEPTSPGTVVTSTSYDASYTSGTVGEFYVRAICPDGVNYSPWAGPFSFGGYTDVEIASGYNADVIANGVGSATTSTNNDIDGGDYAYISRDFKVNASDADLTYGLPISGVISSSATAGLNYQMPDYSLDNSLRMDNGESGTLTFTAMQPAESIFFLVVSGGGSGQMSGTITFDDNTTQSIPSTYIPDWYYETVLPVAISGIGRVDLDNDNLEPSSSNPRIYELEIAIDPTNYDKTISSIDLAKDSGGVINVFAASIKYSSFALATNNVNALEGVAVYPNPVKDVLNIYGVNALNTVEVYNMLGQKVKEVSTTTVNVSDLESGVYLVKINTDNASKTVRIIKN